MCKNIKVVVDDNLNLTINKGRQSLSGPDIEKRIEEFYNGTVTRHVIWDLSDVERLNLSDEDVRRLAVKTSNYGRLRRGGCNAIVVKEGKSHSISLLYGMLSEKAGTSQKNAVFYSFFEAVGWIQSQEIHPPKRGSRK